MKSARFVFWFLMIYEEICRHIRIIFQGKRGVGGQGGLLSSLINIVSIERFKSDCRHHFNSDSQQYPSKLCLIKYCIKYPCFTFWKLNIFICVGLFTSIATKVTHAFQLLQKRWRNEGFKCTSDMPLYNWRITWNYACIPFKYFKISLFPLTKKVLLKKL